MAHQKSSVLPPPRAGWFAWNGTAVSRGINSDTETLPGFVNDGISAKYLCLFLLLKADITSVFLSAFMWPLPCRSHHLFQRDKESL